MSARAVFGFPRVTDHFTFTGGSWLASYPIENVGVLPLSYVARSVDATSVNTSITATADAPLTAAVVALIGHNLSNTATLRIQVWSDVAGTVLVHNSGFIDAWPITYTTNERAGAIWTRYYRFSSTIGSAGITVGKILIEISDTTNADGYVQIGFCEIAQAYDPTVNFDWGYQYGFGWTSQVARAVGGAVVVNRLPKPRVVKCEFPNLLRDEALSKHYEMQRQLDQDMPILVVPFPDETTHWLRTIMFARQIDPGLSAIRSRSMRSGTLVHSVPLALEEIIG